MSKKMVIQSLFTFFGGLMCFYLKKMKTINVSMKKPIEISKELENINFKTFILGTSKERCHSYQRENPKYQFGIKNNKEKEKCAGGHAQFVLFQKSMKILLIFGQCLGLNPFLGVTTTDLSKVRFSIYSWRFFYGILIIAGQTIGAFLCFHRLLGHALSVGALGYFSFYVTTGCTTIIFLRIGCKWPGLVKEVYKAELDEYVDNNVIWKCNMAISVLLGFALSEHILSVIHRCVTIADCRTNETVFYEQYIRSSFLWLEDANLPFYLPIGIALQFFNIISTLNWNYLDLFIVCMSMYLTAILEKLNKKILNADKKTNLQPSFWCSLREDYTRATRLVRRFDDVISSIVFTSFASNLFFICLQIFNVLANGVRPSLGNNKELCPHYPSGPFRGYEYPIYLLFSLFFLFSRYLAVSLYAAAVHSASLVPAPALYNVSSFVYSDEIQRFIDQVHGDKVALSGLQFFYVTRELVLSMGATIVTYELVLLQFSGE